MIAPASIPGTDPTPATRLPTYPVCPATADRRQTAPFHQPPHPNRRGRDPLLLFAPTPRRRCSSRDMETAPATAGIGNGARARKWTRAHRRRLSSTASTARNPPTWMLLCCFPCGALPTCERTHRSPQWATGKPQTQGARVLANRQPGREDLRRLLTAMTSGTPPGRSSTRYASDFRTPRCTSTSNRSQRSSRRREFASGACTFVGAGLTAAERGAYAPGLPFPHTCPRVTPG
jgi:hypothetical protein